MWADILLFYYLQTISYTLWKNNFIYAMCSVQG